MSLYLGAIHFDGDPAVLRPAYHRLLRRIPVDSLDLHVSVWRDGGLTAFDACPTKEAFEAFSHSDAFLGEVAAAGLPTPRIEGFGLVEVAHVSQAAPV